MYRSKSEPISAISGFIPSMDLAPRAVTYEGKGFTFDFSPTGVLHPVLRAFASVANSGLDTAQISSYYQCELPANHKAEIVLSYKGTTDPAITIHGLGKGRVVFYSTTADATWTTLPAKPAFTALMHELLAGSISVGDKWMNVSAGQPLVVPGTLKMTAAPRLTDFAQRDIPMESVDIEGQKVWRSKPLTRPGTYMLSTGARNYPVAVNVPPEAMNVTTLKEPQFRKALGDIEINLQGETVAAEALASADTAEFGWYLMLAVLVLAGIECFLAMRFGHYRKTSGVVRATGEAATV